MKKSFHLKLYILKLIMQGKITQGEGDFWHKDNVIIRRRVDVNSGRRGVVGYGRWVDVRYRRRGMVRFGRRVDVCYRRRGVVRYGRPLDVCGRRRVDVEIRRRKVMRFGPWHDRGSTSRHDRHTTSSRRVFAHWVGPKMPINIPDVHEIDLFWNLGMSLCIIGSKMNIFGP